jgi:hypothetical protein
LKQSPTVHLGADCSTGRNLGHLDKRGRKTVLWAIDQLRRLFEEWLADAGSDGVDIELDVVAQEPV